MVIKSGFSLVLKCPDFWGLKSLKLDIGPEEMLIFDHEGGEEAIRLVRRLWCSSEAPMKQIM